ncbi:MAG: abortive infection family protein [Burkholderiales bacterium]
MDCCADQFYPHRSVAQLVIIPALPNNALQRTADSCRLTPALALASVTAACAILEALCKTYIAEHGLELPSSQTIKPLWGVVSNHLKIAEESVEDDDLKRNFSGLSSIVDGIGSYRTHAGSAHGHGKRPYKVAPRRARLAVHAAHTLCLFVMETWQARRSEG